MPNMKITLARIDNRLMHGIVMTQYLPSTNSQRIMVIDDATANDALKKQMMNMAKPNGYASSIITLETAINNTKAGKYDGQRVFVLSKTPDAFLKLIEDAAPLISYRLKRAEEGINFKDEQSIIKYGARVTEILAELNPVEKDVYIKKIAEDTGLKEQSLYDLLSEARHKKEEAFMNNKEGIGTKLYVEPTYIESASMKAEKALLKMMFEDNEYYEIIINRISGEEFNSEACKKIFGLLCKGKEEQVENLVSFVESGCDDVESSKELVNIKEYNLEINETTDVDKMISDFVYSIKSFKIEENIKQLKSKQREYEKKGMFSELIQVTKEFKELENQLKTMKR